MRSIKNNLYILRMIYRCDRKRLFVEFGTVICVVIEELIFNVAFFPFIYIAIEEKYSIETVLFVGIALILLLMLAVVFRMWRDHTFIPKSNLNIEKSINDDIYRKSRTIDLVDYASSERHDKFVWVINNSFSHSLKVINDVVSCLQRFIMLFIVGGIVINLDLYMLLFAALPVISNLVFASKINKIQYEANKKKLKFDRFIHYISRIFYLPEYAAELRMTSIPRVLIHDYNKATKEYAHNIKKFNLKKNTLQSIQTILIQVFSHGLAVIYLAYLALIKQSIELAEVLVLSNSIWVLSSSFSMLLQIIPQIKENSLYIQDYREFIEHRPCIALNENGAVAEKCANRIDLSNISFRYPGAQTDTLSEIDMHIPSGGKIAIVGHNGAGKSTLIKLMLRLYLPSSGEISMDRKDSADYNLRDYRDRFAVVFQDFQIYAASVAENILMDQYTDDDEVKKQIESALEQVDLKERILQHPKGTLTPMTKEFSDDGIVLSGGEGQKVALARVFLQDAGVVILDEPSSALDPMSEHRMLKSMMKASQNKTMIMISHRLSTTKDMDCIYYLEHGKIVEAGAHDELMIKDGKYAELFRLQANSYVNQE